MDFAELTKSFVSIVIFPILILLLTVIILAAAGQSLGIRYLYMKVLLFFFEWGKQKLQRHHQDKHSSEDDARGGEGDEAQIIERQAKERMERQRSLVELQGEGFQLHDVTVYCKEGIEAIVEDEVTKRFDAAELSSWNLLTRTNTSHQFISVRLTLLWFIGWVLRYCILLPFRVIIAVFAVGLMTAGTFFLGMLPDGKSKQQGYKRLSLTAYRIFARSFSAVVTFHNKENRAKGGGICVANHTSPIDIVVLGCDNCYAMVGQAQGGFFGFMQKAFSRAESHIWFHRSEAKDRSAVANRLKNHIEDKEKMPILIFPEGTCINNTSIMMFKKGSFEVGGVIYPAAVKYDSRFADPFWNSSKQSLSKHLLMMLTSWALVVDVWYLPPQTQQEGESAVDFANRVKSSIAEQGGMVDLEWDGGLKRSKPKPSLLKQRQEAYSRRLKPDLEELEAEKNMNGYSEENGKRDESANEDLESEGDNKGAEGDKKETNDDDKKTVEDETRLEQSGDTGKKKELNKENNHDSGRVSEEDEDSVKSDSNTDSSTRPKLEDNTNAIPANESNSSSKNEKQTDEDKPQETKYSENEKPLSVGDNKGKEE